MHRLLTAHNTVNRHHNIEDVAVIQKCIHFISI
jgi:hypothetical protein